MPRGFGFMAKSRPASPLSSSQVLPLCRAAACTHTMREAARGQALSHRYAHTSELPDSATGQVSMSAEDFWN